MKVPSPLPYYWLVTVLSKLEVKGGIGRGGDYIRALTARGRDHGAILKSVCHTPAFCLCLWMLLPPICVSGYGPGCVLDVQMHLLLSGFIFLTFIVWNNFMIHSDKYRGLEFNVWINMGWNWNRLLYRITPWRYWINFLFVNHIFNHFIDKITKESQEWLYLKQKQNDFILFCFVHQNISTLTTLPRS